MSKKIRRRGLLSKPLASGLAILLTLSLTVTAWAGAGTTFSNSSPITINDPVATGISNPYPSNISVSGLMGTVTNVSVTLNNVNHTFIPDVDILLVAPTGANLILLSDVSSGNDITNTTFTLDDAAAGTVPTTGTLSPGTYKPTNIAGADVFPAPAPAASANTTLAAAFNGIDPNGTWSLYATDDFAVDLGTIGNGWTLSVTTSMSSATSFTNGAAIFLNDSPRNKATPYPSTIVSSGLSGAITDINITLTNVNHTFIDDVDIMLVGPTGKRMIIMSDVGGDPDLVGVNITIDDQAAGAFPDAGPIATGSFRPTNIGTGDNFPDLLTHIPNPATAGNAATAVTLGSVFNGTNPNGTWSLYVTDQFTPDAGNIMGGWSITITAGGTFGAKRFTNGDFEGDGKTDIAVQRPSTLDWYWRESTAYSNRAYTAFGLAGDTPVPGDYDGDRKADIAVFRPSTATWYIVQSTNNTLRQEVWGLPCPMGNMNCDVPVPADYDGDGLFDLAVWRPNADPTQNYFFWRRSSDSVTANMEWGHMGDIPVRGHFEGTNGADFVVFRPSDKTWYILNNAGTSFRAVTFGASGDTLVPGDYDADGKTDVAVYRNTGDWFILRSSTNTSFGTHLGAAGDIPVPGDYDADSRTDVAVWRPSTGSWYILNSGTNPGTAALRIDNWGNSTDVPIPRTYLPTPTIP